MESDDWITIAVWAGFAIAGLTAFVVVTEGLSWLFGFPVGLTQHRYM